MRPIPSVARLLRTPAALALFAVLMGAGTLSGQSIVRGEIEGVVRTFLGRPLAEAFVTATEVRTGAEVAVETARDGTFRIPLLRSGEFEIRIESMGFVPQLLQGVRVPPGQTLRLSVDLAAAPPPVEIVDTVFVGATGHSRYDGETGRRVSRAEVGAFPSRRMGLSGLAALSPLLDASLGSEGLPGSMSRVILDGIAFTPAAHPLQRGGAGDLPFLPRIALDQMEVHRGTDVEWNGASGSYVSAMSRSAERGSGFELYGAGTTSALWQADPFSDIDAPDMNSGWGGGALHLPLGTEGTSLFVGVEGTFERTPRLSPFTGAMADRIAAGWPGGEGPEAAELAEPFLSSLTAFSGLTRLDWRVADNAEVMARIGFASLQDGGGRLFASPLDYGVTAPMDGTDVTAGASVLVEVHPRVDLEIRTGFERSTRDWRDPEGGADAADVPSTRFVETGGLLGPDPGLAAHVARTAFEGSGVAHVRLGEHQLKGGVSLSVPSYDYEHAFRSAGEYLFPDPEAIAGGDGVFYRATAAGTTRSFSIPEVGVFVQHRWEPIRGIRITSGLRFDRETLPDDEVPVNARWEELTAIRNSDFESALNKFSTRLGLSWDLTGDGGTVLEGGVGTHYGRFDPAAMNEVIALSGAVDAQRVVGGLGAWPDLPAADAGQSLPTLSILGPSLEAPRTARASFGLSQRLGQATVMHLSGTFRQTRYLLRRSDLNLTLGSVGELPDGRPVYGELTQVGSIVVTDPGTSRRFSEFDQVWSLDPDGWSDYRGLTVALEHEAGRGLDLFASYTYSETEDNLVGARSGVPEAAFPPGVDGADGDWAEGVSDFDAPHRVVAGVRSRFAVLEGLELGGIYRFRSGVPFTPGFRGGVDVNGDGSGWNDPAFVDAGGAGALSCLNADVGRIASRNGCRGDAVSMLDVHLALGLFRVAGSVASLTLDVFNALDAELGLPDTALWLVDPAGTIDEDPGTGVITLPLVANPDFGTVTRPLRPGRLIRVGFRVGLP